MPKLEDNNCSDYSSTRARRRMFVSSASRAMPSARSAGPPPTRKNDHSHSSLLAQRNRDCVLSMGGLTELCKETRLDAPRPQAQNPELLARYTSSRALDAVAPEKQIDRSHKPLAVAQSTIKNQSRQWRSKTHSPAPLFLHSGGLPPQGWRLPKYAASYGAKNQSSR